MRGSKVLIRTERLKVAIFSKKDILSSLLTKNLLENSCDVYIFSDNKEWKNPKDKKILSFKFNYVILLEPLLSLEEELSFFGKLEERIFFARDVSKKNFAKFLLVFPFLQNNFQKNFLDTKLKEILNDKEINSVTVYIGESEGEIHKISEKTFNEVSKNLVKILFSFTTPGKEMAILSQAIQGKTLETAQVPKEKVVPNDFREISYLTKKTVTRLYKPIAFSLVAISMALILPLSSIVISLFSLVVAKKGLEKGLIAISEKSLSLSLASSEIGHLYFSGFSGVPVVDRLYLQGLETSDFLRRMSRLGLRFLNLTEDFSLTYKNIKDMSLELDLIYKELGFLQGDINNLHPHFRVLTRELLVDETILEEIRERVFFAKKLAVEFSRASGEDTPISYLVLFQDNNRIRPAGGNIIFIALATFNNAKLVELRTYDMSSLDSSIVGKVEPPSAIKGYLGKEDFYFGDSNWYPDFPTTATSSEWFLEKALDREVEGVIGVDLEFLKTILGITGPIKIDDIGHEVNYSNVFNFYENEASGTDLPNKQKFLADFLGQLSDRVFGLESRDLLLVLGSALENLDKKHLQVFSHNPELQNILTSLGWDGGIKVPMCGQNCYPDWAGFVEADLGEKIKPLSIRRKFDLAISLEEGLVKRKFLMILENPLISNDGGGTYKAYIRILAPSDSSFAPVRMIKGELTKSIKPDLFGVSGRKEAGVFVEIDPGESTALLFSWESGLPVIFTKPGGYNIFWRKQAGSENHLLNLEIGLPGSVRVYAKQDFSLTKEGLYRYNTLLDRDRNLNISW